MRKIDIKYLEDNNLILFKAISGSNAYGTNTPTSDEDIRGVFILPLDDILGDTYIPQVSDEKNDVVYYEIKRFLELLRNNNPNILELLNTPEDCIQYKHPLFDLILEQKEIFITKECAKSIGGYAKTQIYKASGLNKKQNWEMDKVTRKDVLDFCYAVIDEKSRPLKGWLQENGLDQKFCGVVNIPHARDLYGLFYDADAHLCFSELVSEEDRESNKIAIRQLNKPMGLHYKGIMKEEGEAESNSVRLSSIPKGEKCIIHFIYNKDGYTSHCKDFREYEEWLKKRNVTRYTDVKTHGQQIDGKNMLHCRRLLEMSREIAEGKGIIVRRPNAKYLLSIRKGEVALDELIKWAEAEIVIIDELFKASNLPDEVDFELTNNLLITIRKQFYYEKSTMLNSVTVGNDDIRTIISRYPKNRIE